MESNGVVELPCILDTMNKAITTTNNKVYMLPKT